MEAEEFREYQKENTALTADVCQELSLRLALWNDENIRLQAENTKLKLENQHLMLTQALGMFYLN